MHYDMLDMSEHCFRVTLLQELIGVWLKLGIREGYVCLGGKAKSDYTDVTAALISLEKRRLSEGSDLIKSGLILCAVRIGPNSYITNFQTNAWMYPTKEHIENPSGCFNMVERTFNEACSVISYGIQVSVLYLVDFSYSDKEYQALQKCLKESDTKPLIVHISRDQNKVRKLYA